jgi:hypothetical protein
VLYQPLVCQGLPLIEASRSHSDTPHTVGRLWTRGQPVAETCTWQHTTITRQTVKPPTGLQPAIPKSQWWPPGSENSSSIIESGRSHRIRMHIKPIFFFNWFTLVCGHKRSDFCLRSHYRCHFLNIIQFVVVVVTCVFSVKYELNFSFLLNIPPLCTRNKLVNFLS